MSRPTFMTIDLDALRSNMRRVRELAPGRSVIAMVKANAYGHGIVPVARALTEADAFGVASLEEGVMLREAGIKQPVVLMEGLFYPDEIALAAHHQFTLVVHHEPGLAMLEQAKDHPPFSVWLKIDTGMNRLGFDPQEIPHIYPRLLNCTAVKKPIGLMTHFAEADAKDSAATQQQIATFQRAIAKVQGPLSLANSAGILGWPESHGDWVRPGLMLYGASPYQNKTGEQHGLDPVMTFWSRLIAIQQVKAGEKVGYGGTWTAPHDMRIGIASVGYGDGYPQYAKAGTPTLIHNKECPLVGRVSMDMMMVDLRECPEARIGDSVTLWGRGLPVERIAQGNHTSAYEILTRMTPRPKVVISGSDALARNLPSKEKESSDAS